MNEDYLLHTPGTWPFPDSCSCRRAEGPRDAELSLQRLSTGRRRRRTGASARRQEQKKLGGARMDMCLAEGSLCSVRELGPKAKGSERSEIRLAAVVVVVVVVEVEGASGGEGSAHACRYEARTPLDAG